MALKLSPGEKVLRSWNYAGDNTSEGKRENILLVTDKRLVATNISPESISRTEIPLCCIKSVSSSYSSKRTEHSNPKGGLVALGIILIIVGVILSIISIINNSALAILGLVVIIVSVIVLVFALKDNKVLTSAAFSLVITTYGQEGKPLTIGKSAGDTNSQTVVINSITFNERVMIDIINTIGAIVINKIPPVDSEELPKKSRFKDGEEVAVATQEKNTIEE